ncbi:MAG: hypothetical protein J7J06_10950 [Methanosarcinales archaeon]|nr:hypothetical protein [Methanosarcinales archaeon]
MNKKPLVSASLENHRIHQNQANRIPSRSRSTDCGNDVVMWRFGTIRNWRQKRWMT